MQSPSDAAPKTGTERERQVQRIFSEIAPRYDLLNHVLSLNIDRSWRRKAVANLGWEAAPEGRFLDACAGTFDLALELSAVRASVGSVVASDFAHPMLVQGGGKIAGAAIRSGLRGFARSSFRRTRSSTGPRSASASATCRTSRRGSRSSGACSSPASGW
jgi:hypothetical protein